MPSRRSCFLSLALVCHEILIRSLEWPFFVPEDAFLVVGDNRNKSRDSRFFGPIKRSEVIGQATVVLTSFERIPLGCAEAGSLETGRVKR